MVCLDTGDAHMAEGLTEAVDAGGDTIGHIDTHENQGVKAEHLVPSQGDLAPGIRTTWSESTL